MATNVSAGSSADAQAIAGEGLRADSAAYRPTAPPTIAARNGASWSSKLDPKATMIRITVATPMNRKATVPSATAMARRDEGYDSPTWNPSTAEKNSRTARPRAR
ncbi:MAG: hypothetical protein EBS56_01780 [Planctomycetia bacterium]|nr:hypothetical protein [Planctomycetia bacterium]